MLPASVPKRDRNKPKESRPNRIKHVHSRQQKEEKESFVYLSRTHSTVYTYSQYIASNPKLQHPFGLEATSKSKTKS